MRSRLQNRPHLKNVTLEEMFLKNLKIVFWVNDILHSLRLQRTYWPDQWDTLYCIVPWQTRTMINLAQRRTTKLTDVAVLQNENLVTIRYSVNISTTKDAHFSMYSPLNGKGMARLTHQRPATLTLCSMQMRRLKTKRCLVIHSTCPVHLWTQFWVG